MITASIVLYHTKKEQLQKVIESYAPSEKRKLFLVDNTENGQCCFNENKFVTYISNGKNLGYGAAHNIAIKKAIEEKSEYHIVLNPDLYFESKIIDELIEYANKNKDVVYMLPKVVYPNGEIQYLCKLLPTPMDLIFRRFFPNTGVFKRMNDRYILKDSGYNRIMNPPCLSGCFMFMRTETLQKYNLFFDERFFMYCEDFDLMRRLHRIGKTIFYPKVTIVHEHEKGSYKSTKMLLLHVRSACLYFRKYGWIIDIERERENKKIKEELV